MDKKALLPKNIRIVLLIILLLGIGFAISGAFGAQQQRMWQIYLVNFLFWVGIAQAGVIFSAILEVTNARWGQQMRQVAESFVFFLPISLILLLTMLLGTHYLFPWSSDVVIPEAKKAYLNIQGLFLRNIFGLGLLTVVSFIFIKNRSVADKEGGARPQPLSVIVLILYAIVYTFVAFDFIMSLAPHWYSTIMGMHFFISCFYAGLAVVLLMAVFGKTGLFQTDFLSKHDFHDMGKVIFGVAIFWMSFLWSQFLVIWYGNIPEETEFLHLRFFEQPWKDVTWTVLALSFFLPFLILMNKKGKTNALISGIVGFLILIGLFLHMYILIVPSLTPNHFYFGITELAITGGFLSLFMLCQDFGLRRTIAE